MDLSSFLVGLLVLPIFGAAWLLTWKLKLFIVQRIESPDISDTKLRATLAARVFGSRRVYVTRFSQATVAITLGRAFGHQQRADMALRALADEYAGSNR
jgi:hypothetical protein